MITLSENCLCLETIVELAGVANSDIGAGAAFGAIESGELVALEQRGRIENETLRILVGKAAGKLLVGADEDLCNRFDHMARIGGCYQDRITGFKACCHHAPRVAAIAGKRSVIVGRGGVDINRVQIAARCQDRRQPQSVHGGEGAFPFQFGAQTGVRTGKTLVPIGKKRVGCCKSGTPPCVIGLARQRIAIDVKRQLAAGDVAEGPLVVKRGVNDGLLPFGKVGFVTILDVEAVSTQVEITSVRQAG